MNKCECPKCGEIELVIADNGDASCDHCNHYEKHVARYPGVDEFIHDFGYQNLDGLGITDIVRVAFLGGRVYESQKDLETLKTLNIKCEAE